MSRIGKQPIQIPAGVTAAIKDGVVTVKGKLGELAYTLPRGIAAAVEDGKVVVTRGSDERDVRAFHGLARTLVANMVLGVATGYGKNLEIEGVGFKAAVSGQKVSLALGFASPKEYNVPAGVKVTEQGGTKLAIAGIDKQLVGRVAADIRAYYPAEPYKGKGIRYTGEKVRRKEGKTVA
jgi:large subunit ribosomal protein L6